jgi:hypothetical protein
VFLRGWKLIKILSKVRLLEFPRERILPFRFRNN